jgi:hypothetical protein
VPDLAADLDRLPGLVNQLQQLADAAGVTVNSLIDANARHPLPAGPADDEIGSAFEQQFRPSFNAAVEYLQLLSRLVDGNGASTALTHQSLADSINTGLETVSQFRKG